MLVPNWQPDPGRNYLRALRQDALPSTLRKPARSNSTRPVFPVQTTHDHPINQRSHWQVRGLLWQPSRHVLRHACHDAARDLLKDHWELQRLETSCWIAAINQFNRRRSVAGGNTWWTCRNCEAPRWLSSSHRLSQSRCNWVSSRWRSKSCRNCRGPWWLYQSLTDKSKVDRQF